jgi:Protein of unknown function (DUF1059)
MGTGVGTLFRRSGTPKGQEDRAAMTHERRVFADCRAFPSENKCSLYVAGTTEEVVEVAVAHAVRSHGHADTPQFREQIRAFLKDEPPGR